MSTRQIVFRQGRIVPTRLAGAEGDPPVEADPYTFDVVASDESVDSHGTVLRGWDLTRYEQNPIVLFGHDDREPIGTAVVRMDGTTMRATITLAEEGTSPIVDKVRSLRRQKILRGVSVGFWPDDVTEEEVDGRAVLALQGNELMELSVCSVPSNPNALADLRARAVRTTPTRSPVSTAKKPVTRAPDPKLDPNAPEADKPKEKPPVEGEPVQKDAAGDAEHQVYVDHMAMAVSEMTSLDDAQRAEVQAAIDKHLAAAKEEVDGMEPAEMSAEEAARSAGAATTVEKLSRDLASANARAAAAEQRADKAERDAIIESAKRDHQWSPALVDFLAGQSLPQLRAWKKSAPKVVPSGEVEPPAEAADTDASIPASLAKSVEAARKGGWMSIPAGQRAAIERHSKPLATRLRAASKA